jgi:hypothetical protein
MRPTVITTVLIGHTILMIIMVKAEGTQIVIEGYAYEAPEPWYPYAPGVDAETQ